MPEFHVVSEYQPAGDQPAAIASLARGVEMGLSEQTLLGVTGSGKTFTMAKTIEAVQRPTLVLAHNKTLAAQLCAEFKEFFPDNAVEYFVSYYDYYQPEAYIPHTDTYIEKDAATNEEIDRLRLSATCALLERRDVIVVSSVSCIYGLGEPEDFQKMMISLRVGNTMERDELLRRLVEDRYERNDIAFERNMFRVRGDTVEIFPAYWKDTAIRVEFFGDEIDRITEVNVVTGAPIRRLNHIPIWPASHYITPKEKMDAAIQEIYREMEERVAWFQQNDQLVEAQRLKQRVLYDIEMMQELGYCNGIENYSRVIAGRPVGSPPMTLLDYFPKDFLLFIDESHVTLPQVRAMYNGDKARKTTLVDYGFRLPCAYDNRPLNFEEFYDFIEKHPEELPYGLNMQNLREGYDADFFRNNPSFVFFGMQKLLKRLREEGKCPVARDTIIFIRQPIPGEVAVNTIRLLNFDGSDVHDLSSGEMEAHLQIPLLIDMFRNYVPGFENCYLTSINSCIGVRESRRIVGEKMLDYHDCLKGLKPDDTIALCSYFLDIHNGAGEDTTGIRIEEPFGIPYLCLVSKDISNLMMAGRDISVDPVTFGATRIMNVCMAAGQAAGEAAAMAVSEGKLPKEVDVQELRKHLLEQKAILDV